VTTITFIFETFPYTYPKEKKVGGHDILYPLHLKKWGDMSPTKLRPWQIGSKSCQYQLRD